MQELGKLQVSDVPVVTKAWEHNGEILGITSAGELLVLARLAQEGEPKHITPQRRQRPPRRRRTPDTQAVNPPVGAQEEE
jgi:hypothetical protein